MGNVSRISSELVNKQTRMLHFVQKFLNKRAYRKRHPEFVPSLLTGALCSSTALLSSSSTLLRQLWQIHSGTSPSSDCDSEGTASASLRPGASLSRACESAGTASASLEPWPGSPFARPEPQSLNSRWHSKQHVCTDCGSGRSSVQTVYTFHCNL